MKKPLSASLKKAMKQEALERMSLLKLGEDLIKEFEEEDIIYKSEREGYTDEIDEELESLVAKMEKEKDILVYHIYHVDSVFIQMDYLFAVTNYKDDWDYEKSEIKSRCPIVYAINKTYPDCSEIGSVPIIQCREGIQVIY